jgi:hypothetical protein
MAAKLVHLGFGAVMLGKKVQSVWIFSICDLLIDNRESAIGNQPGGKYHN